MEATWDDASTRWLEQRRGGKWFKKDEGYVERLKPHLGGLRLADITPAKVATIRDDLSREREAGTVNRIMGVLRAILKAAVEYGDIKEAPSVKRLAETERERFLTPEEAARLIAVLPKHIQPIVRLALATGLRQFNLLNLEWGEVDLTRKWVAIPGKKMKNGHSFGAPLNDAAIEILARQKGKHPRWVFPIQYAGKLGPLKSIDYTMWKTACDKAGIEDFKFHDLRHTWASWHVQHGTHMKALMQLGGWKTPAMVNRYGHLAGDHLAASAANIGDVCLTISPAATSRKNFRSARSKLEG
jgi:integrase